MALKHFTERHIVKLIATQTRRADLDPVALARAHTTLGRLIAGELVEELPLAPSMIQHPQGLRSGWCVADEDEIVLVIFMRAGLYVGEGVREVLPNAQVVHVSPRRGVGLSEQELDALGPVAQRRVVLIDAVVNTGASMEATLAQLRARGAGWIAALALVSPLTTAMRMEHTHADVSFYFARLSENQYVGSGATDTGNRLFGTKSIHSSEEIK